MCPALWGELSSPGMDSSPQEEHPGPSAGRIGVSRAVSENLLLSPKLSSLKSLYFQASDGCDSRNVPPCLPCLELFLCLCPSATTRGLRPLFCREKLIIQGGFVPFYERELSLKTRGERRQEEVWQRAHTPFPSPNSFSARDLRI